MKARCLACHAVWYRCQCPLQAVDGTLRRTINGGWEHVTEKWTTVYAPDGRRLERWSRPFLANLEDCL